MKAVPCLAILALSVFACNKTDNPTQARGGFAVSESRSDQIASSPEISQAAAKSMAPLADQGQNQAVEAVSRAIGQATLKQTRAISATQDSTISPTMLIRTGQASIGVDELDPALAKVRELAAHLGGYVASSSLSGGRDQVRSATLELKIPAAKYDQATIGLNGIGKLESINTTAEDVGEEYVDVSARVANGHRLEERLVNLLATRTGKLEDVLAVERELARVREEIERYDGRMRFLRTRAAMSTLSVTVHEPIPILGRIPGENPVAVAFRQAWRNFVMLTAGFIASLGVLIPVGAVALGAWWVYRKGRRDRTAQSI